MLVILGSLIVEDSSVAGGWRTATYEEEGLFPDGTPKGSSGLVARVHAAAACYGAGTHRKICTIGLASHENIRESVPAVVCRELVALGVPAEAIVQIVMPCGNTTQELLHLKQLLGNLSHISVLTNAHHIDRVEMLLEKCGALTGFEPNIVSAEHVLWMYPSKIITPEIIDRGLHSEAMRRRNLLERQGLEQLCQGLYDFGLLPDQKITVIGSL